MQLHAREGQCSRFTGADVLLRSVPVAPEQDGQGRVVPVKGKRVAGLVVVVGEMRGRGGVGVPLPCPARHLALAACLGPGVIRRRREWRPGGEQRERYEPSGRSRWQCLASPSAWQTGFPPDGPSCKPLAVGSLRLRFPLEWMEGVMPCSRSRERIFLLSYPLSPINTLACGRC